MKITTRTREFAAQLCSMAACNVWAAYSCALSIGLRQSMAIDLAELACDETSESGHVARWAEAEAILRCGWSP